MKIFNHSYIRVLRDLRWKKEQLSVADSLLLHYERILRGVPVPYIHKEIGCLWPGTKKNGSNYLSQTVASRIIMLNFKYHSGILQYIPKDLRPSLERKKIDGSNYLSQTVTSCSIWVSLTPILFNTYIRIWGPQGRKKISPGCNRGRHVMEVSKGYPCRLFIQTIDRGLMRCRY